MTVRVGIIGCGAIARRSHIPGLLAAGAQVTACASRSLSSAEAAATEAGGARTYEDWRDLIATDDVDAVVIATPNVFHGEQAEAAALAGKHVLVEKPFTISVAEADAVIAAADKTGVVAMASHNMRFIPALGAIRDVVQGGALGTVTSVRAAFAHGGPGAWAPDATWFYDGSLSGGGALIDLGVHMIDALHFILGEQLTDVSAIFDQQPVDLDAMMTFRLASGAVGELAAGWRVPHGQDFIIRIIGTAASVALDSSGLNLLKPAFVVEPLAVPESSATVHSAWLEAIAAGHAVSPTAADGRAAVAVLAAAYGR